MRSRWKYYGLNVFGIRIAEPHHDGTPHWHILLFINLKDKARCLDILRAYALKDSPDEPGAHERRLQIEAIDTSKGSAIGYVAKYISKNVDGFGIDADEYGHEAVSSAERVKAWAGTWGIRQFQMFGTPPVTVWRELRRLRQPIEHAPAVEQARRAADAGDWAAYTVAMGGGVRRPR